MSGSAPWCVVPVKRPTGAKSRLARLLTVEERAGLVEAMFIDVATALTAARGLAGVVVVTGHPSIRSAAGAKGFRVIDDPHDRGTNPAVALAAGALAGEGVAAILVLLADLPLAMATEIEGLLGSDRPGKHVVLAPDVANTGTNAALMRPADLMPFSFGEGSFHRHREAAAANGAGVTILNLPGLALDVDRPEDLSAVIGQRGATAEYLSGLSIGQRLMGLQSEAVR